jgi:ElaB/YqjD/DUF883 family membrane-anchored ribosome-binding protein
MAEENKIGTEQQGAAGAGGTAGSAIPAPAQDKLESSRTHARQAAEDLKTAATHIAEEYRGRAEEAWGQARDRVRTFQEDSEQYVRDNPTKAVFTALGVGFILGLIFRR